MRNGIRLGRVSGIALAAVIAAWNATASAALPPGRPYVLTIKGENQITFVPEAGLPPLPIDYKASIEYLVNNRTIEPGAAKGSAPKKKSRGRASRRDQSEANQGDDAPRAAGSVDLAVHSAEMTLRQRGQTITQARVSRARFQGRFLPDAPVLSVTYNQAPPALQEVLKTFDMTVASILIDDRGNVLARRAPIEGPLHAIIATLLSVHTPIPKDVAFWEAPTQLAMGHGQTAKGTLRFEKEKSSASAAGGLIKVKVSGVLQAEGLIVGNLIKDGTYTVSGEQTYDSRSRDWTSAHWSVEIRTELGNQAGVIAHGQGKMQVESRQYVAPAAGESEKGAKR
jgi:hypothetical protein